MCTAEVKQFAEDPGDKIVRDDIDSQYHKRVTEVNEGNATGKAMQSFEGAMTEIGKGGKIVNAELDRWFGKGSSGGEDTSGAGDTQSANYTKSSSEKASKSGSKSKKKGREGTGGSKRQFVTSSNK